MGEDITQLAISAPDHPDDDRPGASVHGAGSGTVGRRRRSVARPHADLSGGDAAAALAAAESPEGLTAHRPAERSVEAFAPSPRERELPERAEAPHADLLRVARTRLDDDALRHLPDAPAFRCRAEEHLGRLVELIMEIYGDRAEHQELAVVVGDLAVMLAGSWAARSSALRQADAAAEGAQPWWLSRGSFAAAAYADRWAGGFAGVQERIPYLQQLGVTHLRLMPPFRAHPERPDGGFAVSSHRETDPRLGGADDLRRLADALRRAGISLMLDVVTSRTSSDHDWARAAADGSEYFERLYQVRRGTRRGSSRPLTLDEAQARSAAGQEWVPLNPGSRFDPRLVRSTAAPEQWDLDWTSPHVLLCVAGELLHVAGLGAQVLRVDPASRLWSGDDARESHRRGLLVLEALAEVLRIAAPSSVLETQDADDVRPGGAPVGQGLGRTSLIWSALATRSVEMLERAVPQPGASAGTGRLLPVRQHDALSWGFGPQDVPEGIDPQAHREFLDRFYTGGFPGAFAAESGCVRTEHGVCGTSASLSGVREEPGAGAARLLLAHAVAFSMSGVPELWLGDELAVLNDVDWQREPGHADDPRWLHRPRLEASALESRHDFFATAGQVYGTIRRLAEMRAAAFEFEGQEVVDFDTRNPAVLGLQRVGLRPDGEQPQTVVLCLANFSDWAQFVTGETLSGFLPRGTRLRDDVEIDLREGILLEAHGWSWVRVIPR
ncbi:alpha-amylase family glycosyl hydrolase [Kocuria palustris]|uniref:alpha-amylase family glycosyl hydrolase n=1 Tax=Kocuria palustris TaxID=71999 RepID=UPI00364D266E